MLTPDELDQLAADLLDLIEDRSADILGVPRQRLAALPVREQLTAALEVDAGLRTVAPRVSRMIDDRARAAGMSFAAVGAARGQSRQSVHRRVNAR